MLGEELVVIEAGVVSVRVLQFRLHQVVLQADLIRALRNFLHDNHFLLKWNSLKRFKNRHSLDCLICGCGFLFQKNSLKRVDG